MITGYVFNDSRTSAGAFFRNMFRRLIVPWLCFTLPLAILYVPSRGLAAFTERLAGLLSGRVEWYMPCCVIAMTIWFTIRKACRTVPATCACALAVFISGIAAARLDVLNYAMANRAMIMQLFILAGYLFRVYRKRLDAVGRGYVILLCAVYAAMGFASLSVWPGRSLDVHLNRYYSYPYCFAMMLVGCFAAFMAACRLRRASRVMCFIGRNTLVYYLLHSYVIFIGVRALSLLGISLPDSLPGACARTLIACVGCGVAAYVLNRYLPWTVGKKRVRPGGA